MVSMMEPSVRQECGGGSGRDGVALGERVIPLARVRRAGNDVKKEAESPSLYLSIVLTAWNGRRTIRGNNESLIPTSERSRSGSPTTRTRSGMRVRANAFASRFLCSFISDRVV